MCLDENDIQLVSKTKKILLNYFVSQQSNNKRIKVGKDTILTCCRSLRLLGKRAVSKTMAARDIISSKHHHDLTFLLSQLTPFHLLCSERPNLMGYNIGML